MFHLVTLISYSIQGPVPLSSWGKSWSSRGVELLEEWSGREVPLSLTYTPHLVPELILLVGSWLSTANLRAGSAEVIPFQKRSAWMLVCLFMKFKKRSPGEPLPGRGEFFWLVRRPHFGIPSMSWLAPGRRICWLFAARHYQGSTQELWGVLSCWVPPRRLKSQAIFCGFTWDHGGQETSHPHPNKFVLSSLSTPSLSFAESRHEDLFLG